MLFLVRVIHNLTYLHVLTVIALSLGDVETIWPTIIPMIQCAKVVKTERESRENFLNMVVFVNHSKSLDGLTRKNEHFVL